MLLGLSGKQSSADIALANVTSSEHGDGGVAKGELLARFAEEIHSVASEGLEADGLNRVRAELRESLGQAGLVDAAAVCANFNMMVRIADGTGTPLDKGSVPMSEDLRAELGLDELVSRRVDAN